MVYLCRIAYLHMKVLSQEKDQKNSWINCSQSGSELYVLVLKIEKNRPKASESRTQTL